VRGAHAKPGTTVSRLAILAALAAALLFVPPAHAVDSFTARVIKVHDGDTITVERGAGARVKVQHSPGR